MVDGCQNGVPMDVKMEFLNGFVEEELYMVQPEDFEDPNHAIKLFQL
jgi:hypothetical protein